MTMKTLLFVIALPFTILFINPSSQSGVITGNGFEENTEMAKHIIKAFFNNLSLNGDSL